MVLEGYFDESVDDEWFTIGAAFSTGLRWQWLSVDWDRCIKRWSKRMTDSGRKSLRRYHGTDCAGRNGDFEGWSEQEQQDFLRELRSIMENANGIHTVSLSLRPGELADVFELTAHKAIKRACYKVLLQYIMFQLGEDIHSRQPGYQQTKVILFHDQTKDYDSAIKYAFDELQNDPGFRYKQYFTSIMAKSWQNCILLQIADMVAFESRKQVLRSSLGSPLGGELKKLLDLPTFGGSGRYFRKDNLQELKRVLEEIKYKLGAVPPTQRAKRA